MIDFLDITEKELEMLENEREKHMPSALVETRHTNPVINDLRFNYGFVMLGNRLIHGHDGVNFELHEFDENFGFSNKHIHLGFLSVPKDKRKEGLGTKYMEIFCKVLDKYGYESDLEIDTKFGMKKSVLKNFYKKFGYVVKKSDYKDSMFRKVNVGATITKRLNENKENLNK